MLDVDVSTCVDVTADGLSDSSDDGAEETPPTAGKLDDSVEVAGGRDDCVNDDNCCV